MDDDIVLNVDFDNAPEAGLRSFKIKTSGRWTDRLKAKRIAVHKRKKAITHVNPVDADSFVENPRPVKRQRVDRSSRDVQEKVAPTKPSKHIVSSLFTSNPRVSVPSDTRSAPTHSLPTNAPVTDASSFLGLGLNPLLATHLETKMIIKAPTAIQIAAFPVLLSDSSSRDVFIQSQTGSGKTLSFLLPILQDLLPLSAESYIDRSIGTMAIIIAPTRELAKQISDVLEQLLSMRLHLSEASDAEPSARLTRWIIPGLLTGGATRAHEKARLRKGIPILVATPGRLLDHLQNTSSFDVGKCRWLVLDEADRLMDLGFEETITGILKSLHGRANLAMLAAKEGKSMDVGGWDWTRRRRTVLCSATIREDVQKLAGIALQDPIVIKGNTSLAATDQSAIISSAQPEDRFVLPAQLQHKYLVVPLKLRLVTLVALLRSLIAKSSSTRGIGTKLLVFFSSTDSVDFHWELLRKAKMVDGDNGANGLPATEDGSSEDESNDGKNTTEGHSALLPGATLFRLHGSLALPNRMASFRAFSAETSDTRGTSTVSVLLCTSVASRGLDFPRVGAVIQYDLPTEGGATEYVHRVGRTARLGKRGEAWAFVAPHEESWVAWLEGKLASGVDLEGGKSAGIKLSSVDADAQLRVGFGGTVREFEERATQVQTAFERWVLSSKENTEVARRAFASYIRAYATHPSEEKKIFHMKNLHLGHVAKAFALRDAPSSAKPARVDSLQKPALRKAGTKAKTDHDTTAGERMREVVRTQGKLVKKGGALVSSGTAEFQVAASDDLEKLVGRYN